MPIRQPKVICIQKNAPPGAVSVLINQDHVDTDLIHPIDSLEKRMFDGIDGTLSIAEITKSVSSSMDSHLRLESARDFFERLWQYDHVVFDASTRVSL